MIPLDLSAHLSSVDEYTELRAQRTTSVSISLVKGNLVSNARSTASGVSARVYQRGAWGFASRSEVTDEALTWVKEAACRNAKVLARATGASEERFPPVAVQAAVDHTQGVPLPSQEELLAFARDLDSSIERTFRPLTSRSVRISCLDIDKALATSDGTYATSILPRSLVSVSLTAEGPQGPVDVFQVWGGLGRFSLLFPTPDLLGEPLHRLHEHLCAKCHAVYARAGVAECVLDGELAGLLAHEAIGHTVEADFVQGGSVAAHYLGREVASPLITMVDFAHTALGATCPVPVEVDDEGVPGVDAVLIREGVLTGYLHNRQSAARFGVPPTGNARAFRFSDEPLIRMRNTAILPGSSSLEEMIASVDDGYYLIRSGNGQADSTGEFMFGIVIGYEIKHGKVGRAIHDTTISGVAFQLLKTVTMVSREMVWESWGMCGKKQSIPVGMGGPAVKCTVTIGGR